MHYRTVADAIVDELRQTLSRTSDDEAAGLIDAMVDAQRVFAAGAGRSGLMMRGFAMRLMHLGIQCHVVGETVTPAIRPDDLLLIGSGSGATASLVANAQKARAIGARIGLVTIQENSPIAKMADAMLTIPAPTPKIERDLGFTSIQPMGSLFEQSLMLVLDALVLCLMDRIGMQTEEMFSRHANLE